ncbi:MAG: serine hydrolase domain-containing protein, partial [Gammaproteobacteria bacterium]
MRKLSLLLFALCFAALRVAAQPAPAPLADLDSYVQKIMHDWQVPGLAVAVVKDGKVVLARGYGVRALGQPGKVDANTLFTIASNSKAFTAAALGTLVAAGKLHWDDPVTQYLPRFELNDPWVTRQITVRDLLTHRSGYCDP